MARLTEFLGARLPVVALVGRPNAGKSTLFNRLLGQRKAIVDEQPGVTRDLNIAALSYRERRFLLIDTGGVTDREDTQVLRRVQEQTWLAASEADVVIALFDGREGLNPLDADLVARLRRFPKPVVFAVNKLDTEALELRAAEFFRLGLERVFPISAAHGRGVPELMDTVLELLPREEAVGAEQVASEFDNGAIRLAIIGRPNVGKSSLLNRLVGYQRAIVDATPGTTRDSIDTPLVVGGRSYLLIDTAGVRRRSRVREILERASVVRALQALQRAQIALLVVDAVEGVTDQDARLARYAWEAERALVLVFNKWDAVAPSVRDLRYFEERLHAEYPFLAEVPRVFLSAQTGEGIGSLFPLVQKVYARFLFRAPTHELNVCLREAVQKNAPPAYRGKPVKLYYAVQVSTQPPRISVFTNQPEAIPASYERYLSSILRSRFRWAGIPIVLQFRARTKENRAQRTAVARRG